MQNLKQLTTVLASYGCGVAILELEMLSGSLGAKQQQWQQEFRSLCLSLPVHIWGLASAPQLLLLTRSAEHWPHNTALVLSTAGQTASGCWTTSRRWHKRELFLWTKITVKCPQTHNYSTWFYLTKLLTSRPLGFPAVLLLAGTPKLFVL